MLTGDADDWQPRAERGPLRTPDQITFPAADEIKRLHQQLVGAEAELERREIA